MTDSAEKQGRNSKQGALPILDNEASLQVGRMQRPLVWGDKETGQPRALRGLARIVAEGLCHRCGSCVGICPTGVLATDEESYPYVENLSACTDCDLCVRVCPGDEFNYQQIYSSTFAELPDLRETHGHFTEACIAYSNRPGLRESSTSGGVVTELLLSLLESGEIDGAGVIVSDEKELWRGKPIIARSSDELWAALKSKYAIAPTNQILAEIRRRPGRYAVVGLPCQIHGLVKAAKLDRTIKERIVLTIGLFCHAAIEHDAFRVIWQQLGERTKGAERFISRVGKHPGAPHLEYGDGSLFPVYFGRKSGYRPSSMEIINIIYRLYTPARCLTCFDALSEFADIAVGDPWLPPPDDSVDFNDGWSFALLRTERGRELMNRLVKENKLTAKSLTRREALSCNHVMATEKRWRAFRVIETLERQGKAIPLYGEYGELLPKRKGWQFVATELHMLSHIACFLPRLRAPLLRFFLGDGGYVLLWVNNKRRRLKVWIRDSKARIMRRIYGRR